jgi:virginiamycin B lyase
MRLNKLLLLAGVGFAPFFFQPAQAQNTAALTGQVSSADESAMEGVVVSAKKDGSNITISVVTDDKGKYSFPADRLTPGQYKMSVRAVGYVLDGAKPVDVAAGAPATADLKLAKTKNLTAQLSSAEWLISAPGEDKQKLFMNGCAGCHTLERIFKTSYDPEQLRDVFKRMALYSPGSTPLRPQLLQTGGLRGERTRVREEVAVPASEWLASVNLSQSENRTWPLKTLPRPKGVATKVIYTEYDIPRKDAQPHDVVLDPEGNAWYSDFGSQFVGELDPKTGKVTEYPIPVVRPDAPKGSLNIALDKKGDVWLSMMYQASIVKVDRKTKEVSQYPFPKEWTTVSTQASMISPQNSHVDGKVWTNNQETHSVYRFDTATGTFENKGVATDPAGKHISGYGMPTDSQNNVWLLEFGSDKIGRVDAKTNVATIWQTPTPGSRPRRGRFDEQDRLIFAEYAGNKVGMFDPKTEKFTEWKIPTPWSAPYDAQKDKAGFAWTGSMLNDHVSRIDTNTGEVVDYLLPRTTNIRRVFTDNTTNPPSLWVGSNHGASIVKVEVLN